MTTIGHYSWRLRLLELDDFFLRQRRKCDMSYDSSFTCYQR